MPSLLRDLYNGRLSPDEQCPCSAAHAAQRSRYFSLCDAFQKDLDRTAPSLSARFKTISDEYFALACLDNEDTFVHGFRMGAQLMLEALYPAEPPQPSAP